jgi:acyl phosphate:glycerol-3-phosphate acyltransferase
MDWNEQLSSLDGTQALACAIASYALGCFATGYHLVRIRLNRDIREFESGSTGARNVGRLLGRSGFILTLLGDFVKGAFAVAATHHLTGNTLLGALALICVVTGHIWPATLGFRGGKGVATSLGGILIFDWRLAVAFTACFAIGYAFIRKSTLPAMLAYIGLPMICFWRHRDVPEAAALTILAALVLLAHRQNILTEFSALNPRRGLAEKHQHTKP